MLPKCIIPVLGELAVAEDGSMISGGASAGPSRQSPDMDRPQIVILADRAVADLHWPTLRDSLPAAGPTPERSAILLTFPPGESSKSLAVVDHLYQQLADERVERGAVIVAFGGGVAGDLAGFVAATWLRGIRFLQVPTTLLAAIDASVGGKTGINLPAGKNLVGAFHQPEAVIIDTDFLATLPPRDFTAGLAESVKHAAIRDPAFLEWHEQNAVGLAAFEPDLLSELIARNCAIKADVVSRDEREADLRAILNYGHTIGHALERLLEYELRHGECVALGMRVENELAVARGLLNPAAGARIAALLTRLGLPAHLPRRIEVADVIAACQLDKKVRSGAVHFILLESVGRPRRVADVTAGQITAALESIQPPG